MKGNHKLTEENYKSSSLVVMGQTRFWSLSCSVISGNARIKIWLILILEGDPSIGHFVLGVCVFYGWAGLKLLTAWKIVQDN